MSHGIPAESTSDTPLLGELTPGTEVEITQVFAANEADTIRTYHATGENPPGLVKDKDCFGVEIGEKARVVCQEQDVVRVQILSGNWKGREGWVPRDGVRVPPTEDESSADVVEGLSQWERREIYAAYHAVGMNAVELANSRYPFGRMPTASEAVRKYLDERKTVYEMTKGQGRRELLERYKISRDQLDRIEAEGMEKKWPLWDGLADEDGPIPSFGPARTDAQGRIDMSDEEWEARRVAAIRALRVVGDITDETDTDEVWDQVFRGLEGAG